MPTFTPPPTVADRPHRWACTVFYGTKRERRFDVYAEDRELARMKAAISQLGVNFNDVLVRYVSTVPDPRPRPETR